MARKKRLVSALVFRLGRHSADSLGGFFGRVADLFSRTAEEFSIISGRSKLRVFEPLVMMMSDVAVRTGFSVDDFIELRRNSDAVPAVSERLEFFLDGFSQMVGARSDNSLGVSADGLFPGRGFFQVYLREVGFVVYSAAGFLISVSEVGRVFEGISEARRDRARHMILYGERAADVIPVDDLDIVWGFETGLGVSDDLISARSKELRKLKSRFEMRKRRAPVQSHMKDRVEAREDEFRLIFEGLGMDKAVDKYLEAAGRVLRGGVVED